MLRHVADPAVGEWLTAARGPFGAGVGSLVPRGMPAYARLLHPVPVPDGEGWTTWHAVAEVVGRPLGPTTQWWRLAGLPSPAGGGADARPEGERWPGAGPREGALVSGALRELAHVLERTERAQGITFAFWDGFGEWSGGVVVEARWDDARGVHVTSTRPGPPGLPAAVLHGPRLRLPGRDYVLFRGDVRDAIALADGAATADVEPFAPAGQSPTLWWPDDRSWFVATEVDLDSTVVGGSRELVDALLACGALESFEVDENDSLAYDGDPLGP